MSRNVRPNNPLEHQSQLWHRLNVSTQKLAVLVSIAAFVAGFSYVMLTNQTAAQGFAIKDLQRDLAKLTEQNEKLELKAADLRSLATVAVSSDTMGMQAVDSFEYVDAATSSVAVSR